MKSNIKYALIGCGRISPHHIEAAIANKLHITALCDINKEAADELAGKLNLSAVKIYTDHKKMIANEELDIAAIATPSGNHTEQALDCISAKINVIIEKPVALSIEDADSIIKAAEVHEVKVAACHQNRFNRSVQKLRRAVEEKRFGRIIHIAAHVRWNRRKNYYDQAKWRGTWAQDGGCLMNQCIHNFDLLRWIMGSEVKEVFAYTDNFIHPYIEAEDTGLAVVKFHNGGLGLVEGSINIYPENLEETLYVFGEQGTVKLGGKSVNRIEEWRFEDGLDSFDNVKEMYSDDPPNIYGFGHTPLYTDFIKAIENGTKPYITALEGKKSLELILAIYKSSAAGMPVKLPLEACSTLDFTGRFDKGNDVCNV